MENASKALIIAGAILISIVLVSVGVIVVQSLNPEEALSKMDQQAIDSFNSSFVSAAGSNVRGTVVKTIISNVITSNGNNEDAKQIFVILTDSGISGADASNGNKDSETLSQMSNKIITSHRYDVKLGYAGNGIVNKITITDNSSSK